MWNLVNGKFTFRDEPAAPVPQPQVDTSTQQLVEHHARDPTTDIEDGLFVQPDVVPSPLHTGFDHNGSVAHSAIRVIHASGDSTCVGIVTGGTNEGKHVKTCGTCLAWVLEPLKQFVPISGVYARTINGAPAGYVIVQAGQNGELIFAETKSEITLLRNRLDALTIRP